jgi:hypothetical protein
MTDLRSTITGTNQFASSCTSSQTLTYNSVGDVMSCQNIAVADSQVTYGSKTANTVLAAPNGSAGTPTFRTLVAADIPTLSYVSKTGDTISGNLTFSSNKASVYTDSGSNTVTLVAPTTVSTSYTLRLPTAVASSAGQVLTSDTSGNLSWTSPTAGTVTSVTGTAPITISGTAAAPVVNVSAATTSASGVVTLASSGGTTASTVVQATDSRLSDSRAPNGSASGDLSGTYPSPTVAKLQGIAVSSTSPTTAGQVLRYNGTSWTPNFVAMTDLRSTITGTNQFASSCTSSQTLTYNSVGDVMSCQNIAIADSQITYASKTANTFLAAPNGSAGTPSFRTIAAADLPSGVVTASTYRSVTVDTYGRVTAGTNPTTASGYGLTDTFVNGGNSFGAAATLGPSDAYKLNFQTSGSTHMTMDTSGNVGIGTTSPTATLTVNGPMVSLQSTGTITGSSPSWASSLAFSSSNTFSLSPSSAVANDSIALTFTGTPANGGNYMVSLKDSVIMNVVFAASSCGTIKYKPAAATTNTITTTGAGGTLITMTTIYNGTNYDCYVTWASGYQ